MFFFFFSSRRRHTRSKRDWSSDVCSSDLLRESCASVLQYEGYQVSLCSRGDEARETLKRNRFDIVLLDLYMPEVSGLRLLRTCLEAQAGDLGHVEAEEHDV